MKKLSLIVIMAGLIMFAGKSYAYLAHKTTSSNETVYVASADNAAVKYPKGAKIFKEKCAACHQLTGMGVPGAFPPLKGSDFLKSATKARLIEQVLNGSNEGLTVNGVKYSIPMPPQVDNYSDAVAVINYILNAWGNNYGKATLADAKGIKIKR